jgi:hypothetical protein
MEKGGKRSQNIVDDGKINLPTSNGYHRAFLKDGA